MPMGKGTYGSKKWIDQKNKKKDKKEKENNVDNLNKKHFRLH